MKKLRSANICNMAKFLIYMEYIRRKKKNRCYPNFLRKILRAIQMYYIYNYLVVTVVKDSKVCENVQHKNFQIEGISNVNWI